MLFRSRNRKGKSNKSNSSEITKRYVVMPRTLHTNMKTTYTVRYAASASISSSITIANLLGTRVMAATTTTGYSPYFALRLRRLKIWAPVTTQGTPVTIALTPVGVETTTNCYADIPETQTATSDTLDWPAYIDYKPHELHPSGSWHQTNTTSLALIGFTCPQGSIMDLKIEAMYATGNAPLGYVATLVGATVGTNYSLKIASNLVPVGGFNSN